MLCFQLQAVLCAQGDTSARIWVIEAREQHLSDGQEDTPEAQQERQRLRQALSKVSAAASKDAGSFVQLNKEMAALTARTLAKDKTIANLNAQVCLPTETLTGLSLCAVGFSSLITR